MFQPYGVYAGGGTGVQAGPDIVLFFHTNGGAGAVYSAGAHGTGVEAAGQTVTNAGRDQVLVDVLS